MRNGVPLGVSHLSDAMRYFTINDLRISTFSSWRSERALPESARIVLIAVEY
jgi:hypothetical protein